MHIFIYPSKNVQCRFSMTKLYRSGHHTSSSSTHNWSCASTVQQPNNKDEIYNKTHPILDCLFLLNVALVGHVDTVEELADVLILHGTDLLDEGARAGDAVDVGSLQHDLVLDVGRARRLGVSQAVDDADHFLT